MKVLKEAGQVKSFKQLVKVISEINSEDSFNAACGDIDISFQKDKINWDDHELLYKLVSKVNY